MFSTRAVLVELTIRQWTARKHDKQVSREIDHTKDARNAGKFYKHLVEPAALAPIKSAEGALRAYHHSVTLPWGDGGQRLLPVQLLFDYRQKIDTLKQKFDDEVRSFLSRYDDHLAQAQARLGSLYDLSDYPSASELAQSFGVELNLLPIPTAGDFRIEIAQDEKDRLARQAQDHLRERARTATSAVYARAREVLQRVKNQTDTHARRTRKFISPALQRDLQDLGDNLAIFNLGDDPDLTAFERQWREHFGVTHTHPDSLFHSADQLLGRIPN